MMPVPVCNGLTAGQLSGPDAARNLPSVPTKSNGSQLLTPVFSVVPYGPFWVPMTTPPDAVLNHATTVHAPLPWMVESGGEMY